jgi:hypothetical protein
MALFWLPAIWTGAALVRTVLFGEPFIQSEKVEKRYDRR